MHVFLWNFLFSCLLVKLSSFFTICLFCISGCQFQAPFLAIYYNSWNEEFFFVRSSRMQNFYFHESSVVDTCLKVIIGNCLKCNSLNKLSSIGTHTPFNRTQSWHNYRSTFSSENKSIYLSNNWQGLLFTVTVIECKLFALWLMYENESFWWHLWLGWKFKATIIHSQTNENECQDNSLIHRI